jgi:WD40 repeat protein
MNVPTFALSTLSRRILHSLVTASLLLGTIPLSAAGAPGTKAIAFSRLKRSATVDFEREILPMLKNNCLACHNQTKPKGGLVLETPPDILKGGDAGPAVVPGKPAESLLLKAAAHQDPELIMPPAENKVAASNLKPNDLSLLQLWIEQGAKGEVRATLPLVWQPLPPGLKSIYALALTRDGQFAACGRGNEIFVYELPAQRLVARLNDPQLHAATRRPGAHRDLVNALAFSPDGERLASGGYREVKLWRREPPAIKFQLPDRTQLVSVSPDGQWLAAVSESGSVRIFDAKGKQAGIARGAKVNSARFLGSDRLVVARGQVVELLAVPPSVIATAKLPRAVTSLATLSNRIAVATGDNVIRLLEQSNATLLAVTEIEAPAAITFIDAASAKVGRFIAGSADGPIYVWDGARGRFTLAARHDRPLTDLAVRPDGHFFASAAGSAARLWKFGETNAVAELRGDPRARFRAEELEREAEFANSEIVFRKAALKTLETNRTSALARHEKAAATNSLLVKAFEEKQRALTNAVIAQHQAEKALDDLGPEVKALLDALFAAETESTNAAALARAAKDRPNKAKAEKLAADAELKASRLAEAKANLDKLPAETKGRQKSALDKIRDTRKGVADADKSFRRAELARSTSENEFELATRALRKAEDALAKARTAVAASESEAGAAEARWQEARKALAASGRSIAAIAFSPDNSTLISANDQLVELWSAETGAPLAAHPSASRPAVTAVMNANVIVAGGAVVDLTPRWKLERSIGTGDERSPLADRVNALRFTSDGAQLFTGGGEPTRGGEIKLWRVRDGSLKRDFSNVHSDSVLALDLSPDGKLLASGAADRFAKVVDLPSGKVLKTFEGHTHHVLGVSWKRSGRTLVTAGADNVAKVWDATTGERRKNIDGFGKEVTAVAFVGVSDEAVLSAGDGQVVRVKEKGDKVRSYGGARDFVYGTAVTPDGRVIVAGGADGVLRTWNGADGKLLAEFPAP